MLFIIMILSFNVFLFEDLGQVFKFQSISRNTRLDCLKNIINECSKPALWKRTEKTTIVVNMSWVHRSVSTGYVRGIELSFAIFQMKGYISCFCVLDGKLGFVDKAPCSKTVWPTVPAALTSQCQLRVALNLFLYLIICILLGPIILLSLRSFCMYE